LKNKGGRMVKTSLIKKVNKESIDKIILFNKMLSMQDTNELKEDFDFNSRDMKNLTEGYRNIGLVLNLTKEQNGWNFDWSPFINRVIIKNDIINKLDNVFVSKDFNKVMLLTTKRLLKIDIEKLNEKIELINEAIHHYNKKIEKEKKEIEHEFLV